MIIIPDVHGRTFWKDAVKGREEEEIVFLGDYVDPYCGLEDVQPSDGLNALQQVIAFKQQHPDNVTLLLGNHDLSYLSPYLIQCRHDDENHDAIHQLLKDNLHLFQLAREYQFGDTLLLFSHAGIVPGWLRQHEDLFGQVTPTNVTERINELFHEGQLYQALGDMSMFRQGDKNYGSCVWADIFEHIELKDTADETFFPSTYQIFGHTQQIDENLIITNTFACVDCHHALILDSQGDLIKI